MPVKWLGDGVMVHYREPAGAVLAALELVAQLPEAGLPPAHVGVAAGPVVVQGGDYFGRTVNLAARIAARAGAGQVLVSERVAESAPPPPMTALLRLFNSRHAEAAMSIQYQVAMTSSSNATVTRRVAGSSTTNS